MLTRSNSTGVAPQIALAGCGPFAIAILGVVRLNLNPTAEMGDSTTFVSGALIGGWISSPLILATLWGLWKLVETGNDAGHRSNITIGIALFYAIGASLFASFLAFWRFSSVFPWTDGFAMTLQYGLTAAHWLVFLSLLAPTIRRRVSAPA